MYFGKLFCLNFTSTGEEAFSVWTSTSWQQGRHKFTEQLLGSREQHNSEHCFGELFWRTANRFSVPLTKSEEFDDFASGLGSLPEKPKAVAVTHARTPGGLSEQCGPDIGRPEMVANDRLPLHHHMRESFRRQGPPGKGHVSDCAGGVEGTRSACLHGFFLCGSSPGVGFSSARCSLTEREQSAAEHQIGASRFPSSVGTNKQARQEAVLARESRLNGVQKCL